MVEVGVAPMPGLLGIVRIRGKVNVSGEDEETLTRLCLTKRNALSLFYDTPSIRGMIKKVEKYIAWGEVDLDTLTLLLEKRGRVEGGKRLSPSFLSKLGCQSYAELAEKLFEGKLNDFVKQGLHRTFYLTPPSKGFDGSIRKPFSEGGVFGYHGKMIGELIRRMM